MKKYFFLLIIFLFFSCLEIEEYIYLQEDDLEICLQYGVQKPLLEMLSRFSGTSIDYDDLQIKAEEYTGFLSGLNSKEVYCKIEKINSSFTVGSRIRIKGRYSYFENNTSGTSEFFPQYNKNKISIILPLFEENYDSQVAPFIYGSKFRIVIEKTKTIKEIKNIKLIELTSDKERLESKDISDDFLIEYRGFYIIELPMFFLFRDRKNKLVLDLYL